jgi:hypothetical protein
MSGVQILPDRYKTFVESAGIYTKNRIMDIIKTTEKSGVIFLSGDVHYGQLYTSKCASLTGYIIPEVCSSGLTHILTDLYFNIKNSVSFHTPSQFTVLLSISH